MISKSRETFNKSHNILLYVYECGDQAFIVDLRDGDTIKIYTRASSEVLFNLYTDPSTSHSFLAVVDGMLVRNELQEFVCLDTFPGTLMTISGNICYSVFNNSIIRYFCPEIASFADYSNPDF